MCDPSYGGGGTTTTGTTASVQCPLPFAPDEEEALTQVSVRITEVVGNSQTVQGPVFAEVWLVRSGTLALLLDQGIITAGYKSRNIVGGIGRVGYSDNDFLQVNYTNDSASTVTVQIDYATEKWPSGADAYKSGCQGWDAFNG